MSVFLSEYFFLYFLGNVESFTVHLRKQLRKMKKKEEKQRERPVMTEESVVIQQRIEISYNSPEAREAALKALGTDTNWIYASVGTICNESTQYTLSKTNEIKIVHSKQP